MEESSDQAMRVFIGGCEPLNGELKRLRTVGKNRVIKINV